MHKSWLSWRLIGPHSCTLAVAVSFNNSWRTPRETFRYGGLQLLLLTTVASVVVALPVVLLQLAVGQLSQQDSVGIWRAVPFFKGTGFLRLLISLLCSIYTSLYTAISITYIFYTFSQSIPFWDCAVLSEVPPEIIGDINETKVQGDDLQFIYNATACLNETILAPVSGQPEYYVALAFIVIVLWLLFPFILSNPVKLMKRILYVFGPLVLLLWIVIVSAIGDTNDVTSFSRSSNWINFVRPNIWHGALVQALLSSQTAGGFLISSGDAIYANTDVQWTALIFVGTNILASWVGALFWFAIGGDGDKVTGSLAVLMQIYKVAVEKNLDTAWPLLCFAMLALSGIITMLTYLYPLYDRIRRVGGYKWRRLSMGSSAVGAAGALAALVAGPRALAALEDVAVPTLLSVTAVLEMSAFVFIYGWKILVEDVEFLIDRKLSKLWVMGWCAVPGVIIPITLWWTIVWFLERQDWTEAPWEPAVVIASLCAILILFFTFATISVVQQVQYDFFGKLKSSFKPSRHWGPRDPITHHYWLARREEGGQSAPQLRYTRRQLGQFLGSSNFADVARSNYIKEESEVKIKERSNSDDWDLV
ncbi:unnamed protein product [Euphydryas editha]|uniref:Uncharacterized protein n=1 Tax=Euphydryas editha TaxID=104508 RepID=A0AAU9UVX6_EUPED|nr:unnamed protein product [Euphydryas editha]